MENIIYQRQRSKQICIQIVDKLYVHHAPNVMQVLDILEWIERNCFNDWYVEYDDYQIEFGFTDPIDNLIYCKRWGTTL
jgi:hypothetical protein